MALDPRAAETLRILLPATVYVSALLPDRQPDMAGPWAGSSQEMPWENVASENTAKR